MTDPTTTRPPLWEAMERAWEAMPSYLPNLEGACHAAEIRAVRDWLKVELPEGGAWYVLLTAEADRAERGHD